MLLMTKGMKRMKLESLVEEDNTPVIDSFSSDYRFLSNFHPCSITIEGLEYPSVEHAFQAMKTLDPEERSAIQKAQSPGKAKRAGQKVVLRPDWDAIRVGVMEELVRQKFSKNRELANSLLATGDAQLIEGNTWDDTFWGVCGGRGENWLGKILMKVRNELS